MYSLLSDLRMHVSVGSLYILLESQRILPPPQPHSRHSTGLSWFSCMAIFESGTDRIFQMVSKERITQGYCSDLGLCNKFHGTLP